MPIKPPHDWCRNHHAVGACRRCMLATAPPHTHGAPGTCMSHLSWPQLLNTCVEQPMQHACAALVWHDSALTNLLIVCAHHLHHPSAHLAHLSTKLPSIFTHTDNYEDPTDPHVRYSYNRASTRTSIRTSLPTERPSPRTSIRTSLPTTERPSPSIETARNSPGDDACSTSPSGLRPSALGLKSYQLTYQRHSPQGRVKVSRQQTMTTALLGFVEGASMGGPAAGASITHQGRRMSGQMLSRSPISTPALSHVSNGRISNPGGSSYSNAASPAITRGGLSTAASTEPHGDDAASNGRGSGGGGGRGSNGGGGRASNGGRASGGGGQSRIGRGHRGSGDGILMQQQQQQQQEWRRGATYHGGHAGSERSSWAAPDAEMRAIRTGVYRTAHFASEGGSAAPPALLALSARPRTESENGAFPGASAMTRHSDVSQQGTQMPPRMLQLPRGGRAKSGPNKCASVIHSMVSVLTRHARTT